MKKGKNVIDKLIVRYVLEIILVVTFMVVSYNGFTMNNLSEAREIASLGTNENREIQAAYGRNDQEEIMQIEDQTFVDKGILYIKNPNKTVKDIDVVIQIKKNGTYKIGDLNILVDGKKANMGVVMNLEDAYEVVLKNVSLEAYASEEIDLAIYSRIGQISLSYSFKLVGSF